MKVVKMTTFSAASAEFSSKWQHFRYSESENAMNLIILDFREWYSCWTLYYSCGIASYKNMFYIGKY